MTDGGFLVAIECRRFGTHGRQTDTVACAQLRAASTPTSSSTVRALRAAAAASVRQLSAGITAELWYSPDAKPAALRDSRHRFSPRRRAMVCRRCDRSCLPRSRRYRQLLLSRAFAILTVIHADKRARCTARAHTCPPYPLPLVSWSLCQLRRNSASRHPSYSITPPFRPVYQVISPLLAFNDAYCWPHVVHIYTHSKLSYNFCVVRE